MLWNFDAAATMTHTLENSILNNVLCYISSSRINHTNDTILTNTVAFYKSDAIKSAKELLFKICKENPTTRKSCAKHPNPSTADVGDILNLLEKTDNMNLELPSFLAGGASSMPPGAGFDAISPVMCSLRDEITALREEVSQLRQVTQNDMKSFEGLSCLAQDVVDIKTLLHDRRHQMEINVNPVATSTNNSETVDPTEEQASDRNVPLTAPAPAEESPALDPDDDDDQNPWQLVQHSRNRRGGAARDGSNHVDSAPGRFSRGGTRHGGPGRGGPGRGGPGRGGQGQRGPGRGGPGFGGPRRDGPSRGGQSSDRNIIGSQTGNSVGLTGAQPILDVFIGGCELGTSVNTILAHCQANGVNPKKCELMTGRPIWYQPFKLSVSVPDRDKVLESSFWPEQVFVRKFHKPKVLVNWS